VGPRWRGHCRCLEAIVLRRFAVPSARSFVTLDRISSLAINIIRRGGAIRQVRLPACRQFHPSTFSRPRHRPAGRSPPLAGAVIGTAEVLEINRIGRVGAPTSPRRVRKSRGGWACSCLATRRRVWPASAHLGSTPPSSACAPAPGPSHWSRTGGRASADRAAGRARWRIIGRRARCGQLRAAPDSGASIALPRRWSRSSPASTGVRGVGWEVARVAGVAGSRTPGAATGGWPVVGLIVALTVLGHRPRC
jgi:hypothetical protein